MLEPVRTLNETNARRSPLFPACDATGILSRDRARWLAARREGVGGSEVAAILGAHPYKSALEVYADKVGAPTPELASEAARWGQLFEGPILGEFADRVGREVRPSNELYRHREKPWQLCTPDGVQPVPPRPFDGPGCAEVKTTGYGNWAEEIPAHVLIQVQHQIAVLDCAWGSLVWLPFPERKLAWREYGRHEEFQALLTERVDEFWTRVLMRKPPDADGSDSSRRALYALAPELVDEVVAFDGAEAIADEVEAINAQLRALESRKSLIADRVMQTLDRYKVGVLEDGRYWTSWTVGERHEQCPHCRAVTTTVGGFRACRLLQPRKRPHSLPRERRVLSIAPPDAELSELLAASLEGAR